MNKKRNPLMSLEGGATSRHSSNTKSINSATKPSFQLTEYVKKKNRSSFLYLDSFKSA